METREMINYFLVESLHFRSLYLALWKNNWIKNVAANGEKLKGKSTRLTYLVKYT